MSILEIISGLVGLYAFIFFLEDKKGGKGTSTRGNTIFNRSPSPTRSCSSASPGSPTSFDLGKGLYATLTPDMGNGIPYVKEFEARDPKFIQRLRKAATERIRTAGLGKEYPYQTGNIIHDIGFPYMGAPLSYVSYPEGSTPSTSGTWTPIPV